LPYLLLSDAAQEPDKRFNTNPRKGSDMTDDNKRNDDQDRKKLSDEEMEDVDGGVILAAFAIANAAKQTDEELKAKITGATKDMRVRKKPN
jgi:hypothetical protein